jgi:hypothetical protein
MWSLPPHYAPYHPASSFGDHGLAEALVLYGMTPTGKYGVALVTIGGLLVWLVSTGYANGLNSVQTLP